MKKALVILLCSAMLVAAVSCDANSGNDGSNTSAQTTVANADVSLTSQGEGDHNTFELSRLAPELRRDLPKASIWADKSGELYIYIKEWEAYRHMPELSSYSSMHVNDHCIAVDSETATIAVLHQKGKSSEPTIITYRFNKSNQNVESHAVSLNIKANSESDIYFVNLHNEYSGYFFLISDIQEDLSWPLVMFETTDGGKTWNKISTKDFGHSDREVPTTVKFISPKVGIISYRYVNLEDLCDRTYLTTDGGLTWNKISQLPYPFGDMQKVGYSEIVDIEQGENGYILTIEVRGRLFSAEYSQVQIQFWSEDLINWSLI